MKSQKLGEHTSGAEVLNIDAHGLWVFAQGKEYFLPFSDFPWFTGAKVADILDVRLLHGFHLHWPSLDVDLDLTSLEDTSETPLVYR